jgi:hypothetical protein
MVKNDHRDPVAAPPEVMVNFLGTPGVLEVRRARCRIRM